MPLEFDTDETAASAATGNFRLCTETLPLTMLTSRSNNVTWGPNNCLLCAPGSTIAYNRANFLSFVRFCPQKFFLHCCTKRFMRQAHLPFTLTNVAQFMSNISTVIDIRGIWYAQYITSTSKEHILKTCCLPFQWLSRIGKPLHVCPAWRPLCCLEFLIRCII